MSEKGIVKYINGWMFDEKDFPPGKCIYVVALNVDEIEKKLTSEELSEYKYFLFVHSTHFFNEFNMPKFPILFVKGWENNVKSRSIDYDMINLAVKNSLQVIGYNGENGDLLDVASEGKHLKFHGMANQDSPIDSIGWHPEVDRGNGEYIKGYEK